MSKDIIQLAKELDTSDLVLLEANIAEFHLNMEQIEKELIKIQLDHKDFDAGSNWENDNNKWHEYFPHRSTTRKRMNEYCSCKYCKEKHELHNDLNSLLCKYFRKIRDISMSYPDSYQFGVRGIGLDTVDCCICGKSGMNSNIAAVTNSVKEGHMIKTWFSKYYPQVFTDHRTQVLVGACKEHKEILDLFCAKTYMGVVRKEWVDQIFEAYQAKLKGDVKP